MEIGRADNIDFRQRMEQPPQPRVSVEDDERRLSNTQQCMQNLTQWIVIGLAQTPRASAPAAPEYSLPLIVSV